MDIGQADRILQNLWDRDAGAWHEHWVPIFRKFAHDLVLDAGISSGQLVLDVGCGTGVAVNEAARYMKLGGFVLGIDRSKWMLELAEKVNAKHRNIRFIKMNADHMVFPDELFDGILSNCGIGYATLPKTISEIFRVLRKGGVFILNDWHLKDVAAHRIFGTILQKYRTPHPSATLRLQRIALATNERLGNREFGIEAQVEILRRVGFSKIQVKHRDYTIRLDGIKEYLDLRLERATLKQELRELSRVERTGLLNEFRDGLRRFVRNGRFIFDWGVNFIRAKKPR